MKNKLHVPLLKVHFYQSTLKLYTNVSGVAISTTIIDIIHKLSILFAVKFCDVTLENFTMDQDFDNKHLIKRKISIKYTA